MCVCVCVCVCVFVCAWVCVWVHVWVCAYVGGIFVYIGAEYHVCVPMRCSTSVLTTSP